METVLGYIFAIIGTIIFFACVFALFFFFLNIIISCIMMFIEPLIRSKLKRNVVDYAPIPIVIIIKDIYQERKKLKRGKKFIQTFIRELKNEQVYIKYIKNFNTEDAIKRRKLNGLPINFKQFISHQCEAYELETNRFRFCIDDAFVWGSTTEGFLFWNNVTDKIANKYDK